MGMVAILESTLTNIANAIRAKTGTSKTYKPSEMPDAISTISGGGITPTGTIQIQQNGSVDVTNYATADVNVPIPTPTGTINIVQNGLVDVSDYANANVAVPVGITPTGSQTFTENGTYDVTNIAEAVVDVDASSVEDYGLADTAFNVADRYSGEVSNNRILGYSTASTAYRAAFAFKRPVTINDGDTVKITFEQKSGTTNYSQMYFIGYPTTDIELNGNFRFPAISELSKTYNIGTNTLVGFTLGPRTTVAWDNVSATLHMYVNDILIF